MKHQIAPAPELPDLATMFSNVSVRFRRWGPVAQRARGLCHASIFLRCFMNPLFQFCNYLGYNQQHARKVSADPKSCTCEAQPLTFLSVTQPISFGVTLRAQGLRCECGGLRTNGFEPRHWVLLSTCKSLIQSPEISSDLTRYPIAGYPSQSEGSHIEIRCDPVRECHSTNVH